MKLHILLLVVCLALVIAEPRQQTARQRKPFRQVTASGLVSNNHPYLFLNVPQSRSGGYIKGFEVLNVEDDDDENAPNYFEVVDDDAADDGEAMSQDNHYKEMPYFENDDDDDGNENNLDRQSMYDAEDDEENDDDDDDEEEDSAMIHIPQRQSSFRRFSQSLDRPLARAQSSIMIPDGVMEIEVQSVVDKKTGRTTLLVPRKTLDSIPDDGVAVLLEQSVESAQVSGSDVDEEEARANRVVVRRRRKGGRRRRRRGGRRPNRRRRRGGRRPPRVIYRGNRRGSRRRPNRRVIYRG